MEGKGYGGKSGREMNKYVHVGTLRFFMYMECMDKNRNNADTNFVQSLHPSICDSPLPSSLTPLPYTTIKKVTINLTCWYCCGIYLTCVCIERLQTAEYTMKV